MEIQNWDKTNPECWNLDIEGLKKFKFLLFLELFQPGLEFWDGGKWELGQKKSNWRENPSKMREILQKGWKILEN